MTTTQLLHPRIGVRHTGRSLHVRDHIEAILLLLTLCMILLVIGIWVRDSMTGPIPPVTATITVQPGDTLWSLAKRYGDPNQYILERVAVLAKANGLERGGALHVGQTLIIPVTNRSADLYYGSKVCKRIDQESSR